MKYQELAFSIVAIPIKKVAHRIKWVDNYRLKKHEH
jgi:hypothetical protein